MGMYTGMVLDLETKPETPQQVIEILQYMVDTENQGWWPYAKPDHELFRANGWDWCLQGQNAYFALERDPELRRPHWATYEWYSAERIGNAYQLSVASSIKNYWNQFSLFLDWITPWVYEGTGWYRYEEDGAPTLVWWDVDGDGVLHKFQAPFEHKE